MYVDAEEDFNIVPLVVEAVEEDEFSAFCEEAEKSVLKDVLGKPLYKKFLNGADLANPNTLNEPFKSLALGLEYTVSQKPYEWEGFKKALVPIIWSMWIEYEIKKNGGDSLQAALPENAEAANPVDRISSAFNLGSSKFGGSGERDSMFHYLLNTDAFDSWATTIGYSSMLEYINDRMEPLGSKNFLGL